MADFRGYIIGSFASSRLDRGGIPVVATTGKVSDASAAEPTVDFGINPCQWNSLPPEGTAFVRYLAVRCFVGDTIKWSEMI